MPRAAPLLQTPSVQVFQALFQAPVRLSNAFPTTFPARFSGAVVRALARPDASPVGEAAPRVAATLAGVMRVLFYSAHGCPLCVGLGRPARVCVCCLQQSQSDNAASPRRGR